MGAILRVFLVMVSLIAMAGLAQVRSAEPDSINPEAKPEAPLAYITVAGAPGDGEQALAAALGKRLAAAGVKTASALDTNVYSVEGIVKATAVKGGRQAVRIDWTIFGPDGTTLGGVSQTKLVRKGSLDRKWGAAADAAARAAATAIVKLISPAPRVSPKAP
jgi:hypothetical protein